MATARTAHWSAHTAASAAGRNVLLEVVALTARDVFLVHNAYLGLDAFYEHPSTMSGSEHRRVDPLMS